MSKQKQTKGEIIVFFGPMFSGKTTNLLQKINEYEKNDKKVLVIGYAHNCRYSSESVIVSHDKSTHVAKKCFELQEINDIYQNFDVIAIDEGQFFHDIADRCDEYANNGKIVIVAALDATYQRKAFNQVLNLVPIAEQVFKLQGNKCKYCNKQSSFSNRKIDSKQIELIGGDEIYESLCRDCYFLRQEQKFVDTESKNSESNSSNDIQQDENIIFNQQTKDFLNKSNKNKQTLEISINTEDNSTQNDQNKLNNNIKKQKNSNSDKKYLIQENKQIQQIQQNHDLQKESSKQEQVSQQESSKNLNNDQSVQHHQQNREINLPDKIES